MHHITDRQSLLDWIALGLHLVNFRDYYYLIDNEGLIHCTVDSALARWYQVDNTFVI